MLFTATDSQEGESTQPLMAKLNTLQNQALDKAGALKKKGTCDHWAERSSINLE